jgi:hypothetical protein
MPECALAARSAAETNGSGPQDAIPAAAGSGAKLGISGLDPDAGMRSLPRVNCGATVIEAAHHQRSGCQRDESKRPRISRLSRCVQPITGRIWILIIVWERTDSRTNMGLTSMIRASIARSILAARLSAPRLVHPVQVCTTVARPLGCGKLEM